jgi:hypothetical protein
MKKENEKQSPQSGNDFFEGSLPRDSVLVMSQKLFYLKE